MPWSLGNKLGHRASCRTITRRKMSQHFRLISSRLCFKREKGAEAHKKRINTVVELGLLGSTTTRGCSKRVLCGMRPHCFAYRAGSDGDGDCSD